MKKELRYSFQTISLALLLWPFSAGALTKRAPRAVSPEQNSTQQEATVTEEEKRQQALSEWCANLRVEFKKMGWKSLKPCQNVDWKVGGWSVEGRPLIYTEFGNRNANNTTLILSMVHGDEITPLYPGIRLPSWMNENRKRFKDFKNVHVVVAPMVNPDGFFRKRKTRTNSRGVDVNRNFPTQDWEKDALRKWKHKYRSAKRRYPGAKPNSEPETQFQLDLIEKFQPNKILSIHAPLNFLDYDGPTKLNLGNFPEEYVRQCTRLRSRMKAVSGGFFPGSLGNYAGQELGIPTFTLELPTAARRKAKKYWIRFSRGIVTVIEFKVPELARTSSGPRMVDTPSSSEGS